MVEKTAFKEGGVLEIQRSHDMVNRWNKAIAVGLRHNHDISFIGTQSRTMALLFYVTNYATKLEDPVWKRAAAAAAELLQVIRDSGTGVGPENRTRQFLLKVANRVFTERPLSQVEVAAHLLGFPTEFSHNSTWTYLNASSLYWAVFRRWDYLRHSAGQSNESVDEAVMLEQSGQRPNFVRAYPHRGSVLAALSLYDYMSVIKLKRKRGGGRASKDLEFEETWPLSKAWTQELRKQDEGAVVCLDGYLSMGFNEEDERCHRRYSC